MNISNIKPILKAAMVADDSVIMEGLHGIGKSEIVKQYCTENGYFYTVLFLSHQEVGDLIGMPNDEKTPDGTILSWSKPIWLHRMEEAAAKGMHNVLLLDELNRAQTDVLNSALQLVLERQIHEHHLPEVDGVRTQVIACTNPANDDKVNYMVQSLDPALLDRFLVLPVEVDAESWVKWARLNNVNKIVIDFIVDNQTKIHFTPDKEGEVGATPRSWTKLAAFVNLFDELDDSNILNIIRGKIGSALGSEFYIYYQDYDNNISIEDIEKLIKKEFKKEKNLEIIGETLKEFLINTESITKLDYANTIFDRDKDKFCIEGKEDTDFLSIFVLLYSFELEILTSFLKDIKINHKDAFYSLMKLDKKRELARKIKSKVKNN